MVTKRLGRRFEMRRIMLVVVGTILALAIGNGSLAADLPQPEFPQQVAKKVAMQTKLVQQLWQGQGNVVVGKLDIPPSLDRQQIASRTVLLNDGWFAARLFASRKLSFRAHGFKPIDIQPRLDAPFVYNAGTIKLEAVDNKDLTTVRGIAAFPKGFEGNRILIELEVEQPPQIFADDGYEGGIMRPVVNQLFMPAGEEFRFEKLSNFDYRLRISAPHFIVKEVPLLAGRDRDVNTGIQTLDPSPVVVFNYVSQFSGIPPAETKQQSIECDDHRTFIFTTQRDELGNKLDFRLHPHGGKVVARFWFFPSGFYDLGKIELKTELANFSLEGTKKLHTQTDEQLLEDGHVYYFECPNRKANCLFSVSVPAKQSSAESSNQKIPN
jgi:hypothetical protein